MNRVQDIKRAQKESLLLRTISQLFTEASLDDPALRSFYINRVTMSSDKSKCYVFFYCAEGQEQFKSHLDHLKLYKPSLRKALAQKLNARYTPDLVFMFDSQLTTQIRVETIIESLKENE